MKITRLEQVQTQPIDMAGVVGATKQVPIGKADGAPNFSIRVFTLEPGGHTPHHQHDSEHLNYILEGQARMQLGTEATEVGPGDAVAIPPGTVHQITNIGRCQLKFLCLCAPCYEHDDTVLSPD